MIARFDSKCATCGCLLKKGDDIFYDKAEGAHCWPCRDNPQPTPEQYELAARLQYHHIPWESLLGVHSQAADEPERDGRDARGRNGTWPMPASSQGEE